MKTMSQRQVRVAGLLRERLAELISRGDFKNPLLTTFISISDVWVSADLRHADIYFSNLQPGADQKAIATALNAEAGRLQSIVGRKLTLKYVPKMKFIHDPSFNTASRMDALLDSLHGKGDEQEEVA